MLIARVPLVVFLTNLLGCGPTEDRSDDGNPAPDARTAVMEASEEYMNAVRSLDAGAVAGFWMEGSVLMAPAAPDLRGPAEIERFLSPLYPTLTVLALDVEDQQVEVWGDVAMELKRYSETLQIDDGPPQDVAGRALFIWKQQADGSWKIWRGMFNYTSSGGEDVHQQPDPSS